MKDMLNIADLTIVKSPDVRAWPATVAITAIDMNQTGGLTLKFDRTLPATWDAPFGEPQDGGIVEYTVWAIDPRLRAAGFVQMWPGRTMGDRSLPPILSGYTDWWGDPGRKFGDMSDYVPQPGDHVGFFVTAGNARLVPGTTSVAERSTIVVVPLPLGDQGYFEFPDSPSPPAPPPPPPLPDDLAQLLEALDRVEHGLQSMVDATYALVTRLDTLQQTGVKLRW